MLLLQYTILSGLLSSSVTALVISTTTTTAPTIAPQATTSSSITSTTSAIEFLTTKYITIPGQTDAHFTKAPQTIAIAIPTCIHTITPDKNGYVPPGTCGALYDFYPSFAAAVVFAFLFGMLTVAHIAQAAIFKKKFCWVLIMACIWETISFTARSISTRNQQNSWLELISSLFVLLAPLWVNAFDYMVLGRMIHFFLPEHSVFSIPASVLAIAFVSLDFVSFVVQLIGGSMAGPTSPIDQIMKGIHVYMGGIGLQQFFVFVFVGLAAKFHMEMLALERMGLARQGWKRLLFTLYASLGFITIRIFFRLIEFSGGKTSSNPLPFHEAYFYALEAMPMIFAILAWNITHPGSVLIGPESELPGIKETCLRRKRARKVVGEHGLELGSKYDMLEEGGEREASRYSQRL